MDNAPKSWLLLRTTPRHTHLPAEGTGQPVTYLTGHRLCLQVAELILGVQKTPSRQTETCVSNSLDTRWQRCIQLLIHLSVVRSFYAAPPGLICVNSVQHGSSQLYVPAEFLHVHNPSVHLLKDHLQSDKTHSSFSHSLQ